MLRYILYIKDKFFNFEKNYAILENNCKIKNIIISHLVNYDNINFKNDFYFGELASMLNRSSTLLIFIDHIKSQKNKIKQNLNENFIILSQNLSFFEEIRVHSICLFKIMFKSKNKITLIEYINLVDNERIFKQLKKIIISYKPKKVIFTFEGNEYERLLVNSSKINNLNFETIGYQFGVIKKKQILNFKTLNKKFIAKKILTINKYNEKLLNKSIGKRSEIINIGSLKIPKKIYFSRKRKKSKKEKKILVLPEGIPEEMNIFLNFCGSEMNNNFKFNIRLHPILKNNNYLKKISVKISHNINFSRNSLIKDLQENNYVLYRGTSTIIEAINFNLIPVYLNKINELSVDPLFQINKHHIINEDNKFSDFLNISNKKSLISERKHLSLFAKNYYEKPKINLIEKIFS